MKLFYVIAFIVAAGMIASPLWFLHGTAEEEITRVVTGYEDDGKPIYNSPDCRL